MADEAIPFEVGSAGATLFGEVAGKGRPLVLLHGLSATRRYVLLGSRLLEREGHRVVSYDARGHGTSTPPIDPRAYEYADLVLDLEAVLDHHGLDRAVLVGNSMGAATAMAFALESPHRVEALVQVTPAYAGHAQKSAKDLAEWDALADGLEQGGVDGFLAAYHPEVRDEFRDTVMRFTRQRLERHEYPEAVAQALRTVPRSEAFSGLERLEGLDVPTLIVGSRDESDPGHPLRVAEAYAERLPRAELMVEEPGKSPIAWQGAQLSRAIMAFLPQVT